MIEVRDLTKRYGHVVAVDTLSFRVEPGSVTGFLGPNGAGKSTTLRVMLGLAAPTSGRALIGGVPYARLRQPLHRVGALLDATTLDGDRSAADHLYWLARSNRIDRRRVGILLELVGLERVARRRIASFSLGMKARLGIAVAMLGDPEVLLLDEPLNGLDPEGVRWLRQYSRSLAAEGRTIFVSSHLMSEMEKTADRLVIVAGGRLVANTTVAELLAQRDVFVRTPRAAELSEALRSAGAGVTFGPEGELLVTGLMAADIADVAAVRGLPLHEITPRSHSLEDVYMRLTGHGSESRSRREEGEGA